jgi:protein arginine N-methyltransferase 1
MSLIVDTHREYLSDRVRLDAFAAAIAHVVRTGDVVLDIGTGTGLLGILACRAGARRVYAVEADGTAEVARAVAAANGVEDRMVVLHGHSAHVTIPEPVDVLVADLIGHMGFEAGVFQVYEGARKWLAPGARAIPSQITIAAAPVEHERGYRDAHFWSAPVAGVAFDPVLCWSLNTGYPFKFDASQLLASGRVSATFPTLGAPAMLPIDGDVTIERPGTLHGIAGWFSADMAPGVALTNDPASSGLNRRQVYLPLTQAVPVEPGDRVGIRLRIRPADMLVSWTVEVRSAAGRARESHSTLEGMLITREELRSHDPACRPRLTDRGQARATVLALCDGGHSLAEIEDEVYARHGSLFATPGEAQAFVAEVVSRYGAVDRAT